MAKELDSVLAMNCPAPSIDKLLQKLLKLTTSELDSAREPLQRETVP
jgi:hypothetical protein